MIDAPLALAFTAGMIATVNPCGFAMLPAYLSWFVGADGSSQASMPRALLVGGVVSAGFLAVFALLGAVISAGLDQVQQAVPWITIAIGVGLVGLGIAQLAGRQVLVRLPHLDQGTDTRAVRSMLLFGVSYAIASLSCTIPVFLTVVAGTASRDTWLSGFVAFLAYSLGMAVVLMVVTLAVALAQASIVRWLRRLAPVLPRVAGALLVVSGLYLVQYRLGNQLADPGQSPGRALDRVVEGWSSSAVTWVQTVGGVRLGALAGLGLVALVAVGVWRRSTPAR